MWWSEPGSELWGGWSEPDSEPWGGWSELGSEPLYAAAVILTSAAVEAALIVTAAAQALPGNLKSLQIVVTSCLGPPGASQEHSPGVSRSLLNPL